MLTTVTKDVQLILSKDLYLNASRGNSDRDATLLESATTADIDYKDEDGNTVLHKAIEHGHIDVVKLLINAGASLVNLDSNGNSIIHVAAKFKDVDIFELSLTCHVDINAKNNRGDTPLMTAIQAQCFEHAFTILNLDKPLDIQHKNSNGDTALLLTAQSPRAPKNLFRKLILCGASIHDRNIHGATPLHLAAQFNSQNIKAYILDFNLLDKNVLDKQGKTPFDYAVAAKLELLHTQYNRTVFHKPVVNASLARPTCVLSGNLTPLYSTLTQQSCAAVKQVDTQLDAQCTKVESSNFKITA